MKTIGSNESFFQKRVMRTELDVYYNNTVNPVICEG